MTKYIKCGGGGLPPQVITDMNAVLNKKFSTSTDYPSSEWADMIEEMTALPEKSASGTIAHFNDGADLVPLKSCEVTVTPSQSGTGDPSPTNPRPLNSFSSLKVEHTGANIVDIKAYADWNLSSSYAFLTNCFKANQKTIMCLFDNDTTVDVSGCYLGFVDSSYTAGSPPSTMYKWVLNNGTVSANRVNTASGDVNNILNGLIIYPKNETTFNKIFSRYRVLIQYGETQTATAYEPYTPDPHTLALGSTVYGLTGDCVTGEFEETAKMVQFVGAENENWVLTGSGDNRRFRISITSLGANSLLLSSHFVPKGSNAGIWGEARIVSGYLQLMDNTEQIADVTALKTWLASNQPQFVYELATPTALTIDPVEVESFKGVNNVWCDKDNSSVVVEYRADIELSLNE